MSNKLSKIVLKFLKISIFLLLIPSILISCKGPDGKLKLPGGDARKTPANPEERVAKNLKEGRGFTINENILKGGKKGGVFDFASSNELWRASLDVIDFMPLSSVNYSGGIIITDWYSDNKNQNESIKISIRFLTNEIRSDAVEIKVFSRKCSQSLINCNFTELDGVIKSELKKEILKRATRYKKVNKKD
tara:strand:- start:4080 stop:4649 length:570 start_codon:yes stop_codon:yes gene_type:complete